MTHKVLKKPLNDKILTEKGELHKIRNQKRIELKLKNGNKMNIYNSSVLNMAIDFKKSELIIILKILNNDMINGYNISKYPFRLLTPDMHPSDRTKLKRKMIDKNILSVYNKKLFFSPFVLIPKINKPYGTGAIIQNIWHYVTGSNEWKKLKSGQLVEMFDLKNKIFEEGKQTKYDKKIFENELEVDTDNEYEAILPNKAIISYSDYTNSTDWLEVRNKRIKLDKYKCVECGSDIQLEVHHLTYDRLGHENMDDIQTLCSVCHFNKHYKIGE